MREGVGGVCVCEWGGDRGRLLRLWLSHRGRPVTELRAVATWSAGQTGGRLSRRRSSPQWTQPAVRDHLSHSGCGVKDLHMNTFWILQSFHTKAADQQDTFRQPSNNEECHMCCDGLSTTTNPNFSSKSIKSTKLRPFSCFQRSVSCSSHVR